MTLIDEAYPESFKHIPNPPWVLYYYGNLSLLCHPLIIGVIGTRNASLYGKEMCKRLIQELKDENCCIISGLAKGIDSYAHIGSICANGKTIAVIGNGIDTIYPKENINIANKILEKGGTIISEYPLGTKPEKMNFPARNRIISGISKSVIVVEAKEKSGTLLTVDFALEQGRDVYVVPGNINSINSIGTNELLKQGAKIITCYKDIIVN